MLHARLARLAAFVLAGCMFGFAAPRAVAQSGQPVIVVTNPATPALPFFYARAHGLFEKAGLDVKLLPATTGSAAELGVVGGAAQIGFTNTLTLTNAVAKGVALEAVAPGALYEHAHPSGLLLVLPDSAIRTVADLDGKTVAVTGLNDLLSIGTEGLIDQNGGHSATVHFVEIPPGTMYAALQEHRVDAIADYDPFASSFAAKGLRTIGYPFDGIAQEFVAACYFAKTDWLNAHRDEATRFANVIHDASLYATTHFTELIPFIAQYSKLPVPTLQTLPPETYPGGMYAAQLQPVIDAAAKYEHVSRFVAAHEIFDAPVNEASAK